MTRRPTNATAAVHYRVDLQSLTAHLFAVTLTIAKPAALQRVSLPVWIPGSYLVREFAKNLQRLQAHQGGHAVALTQLGKCSWQARCQTNQALVLQYEIYALDNSVRTAWLDGARGFFNGTSLFLKVEGQEALPHELTLLAHPDLADWQLATGLPPTKTTRNGFGTYLASDYGELVDCPVEMGPFWHGAFVAGGIPHRFVVAGAPPAFDGKQLLADTQRICEAEIQFWHGARSSKRAPAKPPHKTYCFLLNAVDDGYGGLEHRNSTALICKRQDLPRLGHPARAQGTNPAPDQAAEGYKTLLGLISHEYFHTWNVKRLRPAEFTDYDYGRENYTQLLWFFEGFTSYYDDLLLRRAHLIDDLAYLKLLTKTINQVLQTPGRAVQSVAQASMDAWVKYYRQDENTPNATVSYYTKGALVALCLDLTLRQEGKTSLDVVMRALWLRCQGGPMTEADLTATLEALGGRSYAQEVAQWVHGTADLPLQSLLTAQGIKVLEEPAQLAQRLGLRVTETAGVQIKTVLRGGAAEQAGLAAGDEWLGLEVESGKSASAWRINKLDDLMLYAASASKICALVARDKRLLKLPLTLPQSVTTWRLTARDSQLIGQWLNAA
ncbi:peptidase M61 [Rhodoferax ferrireducens T118]|uniref:Peptidase M61 n=1 Tax=Albidiferax ferrireducens (strain ATCC BAA-621 / DSM 15236 / T118) TaxID=338969 RepID=Q21Y47_ALBFT|nr:M61 family metallopeptidase [Rhodoferax ferrireducens]ABD69306.1 peptidase M61 [Rhodoferax ferrireducens T118]